MTAQQSIDKGLAYMAGLALAHISVEHQSLWLILLCKMQVEPELQRNIASHLGQRLTFGWIAQAPLEEVMSTAHALHTYRPTLVSGALLAALIRRLIKAEQQPGGPYTNLDGKSDIDTNILISTFATWAAGPLPATTQYLQRTLASQSAASLSVAALYYGSLLPEIRPSLWAMLDPAQEGNKYTLLMGLRTVIDQASPDRYLIQRLQLMLLAASKQATSAAQTLSSEHQGQIALATYVLWSFRRQADAHTTHQALSRHVFEVVEHELSMVSPGIARQSQAILARTAQADKNFEISLLPLMFAQASVGQGYPRHHTLQLCIANLCGWLAYTLYDEIVDTNSSGQLLPLANICQRQAMARYQSVSSPGELAIVQGIFEAMDTANAWEVNEAHAIVHEEILHITALPQYGGLAVLAERSFGHACGPLIIAGEQGFRSTQLGNLRLAFKHYLIARQIYDDLRDWQEDIRDGQLTYVNSMILRELGIHQGEQNIALLMPRMQHVFWRKISRQLCREVEHHIDIARQQLVQSHTVTSCNALTELFDQLKTAAQQSRHAQQQSADLAQFISFAKE